MNTIEKSESMKAGIRKKFQDGSSKMAQRRCYGYDTATDGRLTINQVEAGIVRQIVEQYCVGSSLGKIDERLEKQGVLFPTGKAKWNREALNKRLSNERDTGRVLLQKTVSIGVSQISNGDLQNKYLYADNHIAIISDSLYKAVAVKPIKRGTVRNVIRIAEKPFG